MHSEPESTSEVEIDDVLERFLDEVRGGGRPSLESYARRYPLLSGEIRELFPVVAAMEGWKEEETSQHGGVNSLAGVPLERLGDFRVVREIGRGGMGIVFEAVQESLERTVAIKVLPPSADASQRASRRFRREAQTAAALHHPHIVPVFGFGHDGGFSYIVMQYIDGCGLDQVLRRSGRGADAASTDGRADAVTELVRELESADGSPQVPADTAGLETGTGMDLGATLDAPDVLSSDAFGSGALISGAFNGENPLLRPGDWRDGASGLQPRLVARFGLQACRALEYAHEQGVLHRDIKPANLLLDRKGQVWVADFGLARALEQESISHSGDIVGTLLYMAPERLHGHCDARSDVYGLAVTLAELVLGRSPFETQESGSLVQQIARGIPTRRGALGRDLPIDLETMLLKAMAVSPRDRYATAGEFADDLQRFIEDRPIRARQPSRWEVARRWARRNPVVAGLTGTVAVLLLLTASLASFGYWQQQRMRQRTEATLDTALGALDTIYNRFANPTGSEMDPLSGSAMISQDTAEMLQQLLAVYDELASQGGDVAKLDREALLARLRVADIHLRLGAPDVASQHYSLALEQMRTLRPANEQDLEAWTRREAQAWLGLATALEWLGEQETAAEHKRKAISVIEDWLVRSQQGVESGPSGVGAVEVYGVAEDGEQEPVHLVELPRDAPAMVLVLARAHYLLGRRLPSLIEIPQLRPVLPPGPPARRGPGGADVAGPVPRETGARGAGASGFGPGGFDSNGFGGRGFGRRPSRPPVGLPVIPIRIEDAEERSLRETHLRTAMTMLDRGIPVGAAVYDAGVLLRATCLEELAMLVPQPTPESRTRLDEAIEVLRALVDQPAPAAVYRFELARALMKRVELRHRVGEMDGETSESPFDSKRLTDSEQDLRLAVELLEQLQQEQPELPEYQAQLARAAESLAITLAAQQGGGRGPGRGPEFGAGPEFGPGLEFGPGPEGGPGGGAERPLAGGGERAVREPEARAAQAIRLQSEVVRRFPDSALQQWWLLRFETTLLQFGLGRPGRDPEWLDRWQGVSDELEALADQRESGDAALGQLVEGLRAELEMLREAQQSPGRDGPPLRRGRFFQPPWQSEPPGGADRPEVGPS